jgi:hypothetical protein
MSCETFFRQCELEKSTSAERLSQVCWIPEKYAAVGRILKLRDGADWSDGWKVLSVGATRRSAGEVRTRGREARDHRDASSL